MKYSLFKAAAIVLVIGLVLLWISQKPAAVADTTDPPPVRISKTDLDEAAIQKKLAEKQKMLEAAEKEKLAQDEDIEKANQEKLARLKAEREAQKQSILDQRIQTQEEAIKARDQEKLARLKAEKEAQKRSLEEAQERRRQQIIEEYQVPEMKPVGKVITDVSELVLKWSQEPDLDSTGFDVSCYWHPQYPDYILADDFLCTSSDPITEIVIWGSWYQDVLPHSDPHAVTFFVSIHSDIPASENPYGEWSMPGNLLWLDTIYSADVVLWASDLYEGWFEPPSSYEPYGDSQCWMYTLRPDSPFVQQGTPTDPIIYWLDIQAVTGDTTAYFGWKISDEHWNDDGCWINGTEPLPPPFPQRWNELRYPSSHPYAGQSIDLAFELYSGTPDEWDCTDNPPTGKTAGGYESEPNNNCPSEADMAQCEYAYCGALSTADQVDWWFVDLPDDGNYHCLHIRVFGDDTPNQYAYGLGLDPTVTLYWPDCVTLVAENEDYMGTFPNAEMWDSQIDCGENCFPPGSRVFIKVWSSYQDYGPYLLIINCETCEAPTGRCCYYTDPNFPLCVDDVTENDCYTSYNGYDWLEGGTCAVDSCPAVPWNCDDNPPDNKYGGGWEAEPNDTCTAANSAYCEYAYCGDINPSNDEDWWMITIPAGGWYSLHLRVFGNYTPNQYAYGQGLDPQLWVYDSDCATLLMSNDDYYGTFPDAELYDSQIDPSEAGNCFPPGYTLYVKVRGWYSSVGPYLFIVNCVPCTPPTWDCMDNPPPGKTSGGYESEPNNVCPSEADMATCEAAYCGQLDSTDTVDWWYIDIPDDGSYHCLHIRVFGDDTPYQYAYSQGLDPRVDLYYPDCNTYVLHNEDYYGTFPDAEMYDSQIDCDDDGNCFPPGSRVYIKIWSYYEDYGPYLLIINCYDCTPATGRCCYYTDPTNPLCVDAVTEDSCYTYYNGYDWLGGGTCADNICPAVPYDCDTNPPEGKEGGGWEDEPNDYCTQANTAQCEYAYCGAVDQTNDEDWWVLTLPSDTSYSLHIDVFADDTPGQYAFGGGLDPQVYVYDTDCATLFFWDDDDGEGTDSRIDTTEPGNCFPAGATVYIKVRGYSASIGPYLFVINCYPCELPEEPWDCVNNPPDGKIAGGYETEPNNNCPDDANQAMCEYAYCGQLDTSDTVDWWYVQMPDDGQWRCLHIRVFGDDTPGQYAYGLGLDPRVALFYPDCDRRKIAENDDYGGTFPDAENWDSQIDCDVFGNCFPPGSIAYIRIDSYWEDYGPYLLIINCYTCDPDELPECPSGSIFWQLPTLPGDPGWFAVASDAAFGQYVYDNYAVDDTICDIHWWGVEFDPVNIVFNCDRSPNMFDIAFYSDAAGVPGAVVCDYPNVTPTRVYTGIFYGSHELIYYSLDLEPCCPQLSGWVSIVGIGDPDCYFYWSNSYDGDLASIWSDGTEYYSLSPDMAFCLTAEPTEPPPTGVNFHNTDGYVPSDGNPINTDWHELWPDFCNDWILTSWFDNGDGILSVCDYVDFTAPSGYPWRKFHVEWIGPTITVANVDVDTDTLYLDFLGDNPLINPITDPYGVDWLEKYPDYGDIWVVTSWSDNGNSHVDYCDYLWIQNISTGDSYEVHVEAVETDITLAEIIQPPPPPGNYNGHNYDNLDNYHPAIGVDPLNTAWHELYPDFCDDWDLTSWKDRNSTTFMDSCDVIDLTKIIDTSPPQTVISWEHILWVGPTIIVEDTSAAPPEPGIIYFEVLRNTDYFETGEVGDPVDNWFWEVHPNYCTDHYCVGWLDNGNSVVDSCDWICLQDFSMEGDFTWYHVIDVRTDMITEPIFFEGINFHNMDDYLPTDGNPTETQWHELWPEYCQNWICSSWLDNGDGILSVCDTVDFTNTETNLVDTFHVEWIGPTITIEIGDPFNVTLILDLMSSEYALMQQIDDPVGTFWFEKWPAYGIVWYISDWDDNGIGGLDSCDYITIVQEDGPHSYVAHVIDVSTDISLVRLNDHRPPCFEYVPGDANMGVGSWPPLVIGSDVTYLVNYFRGTQDACYMYNPPACFYASADANGDCQVIGSDVTRLVTYFRGLADILYCTPYVPCWPTPEDAPDLPPPGWPNCVDPCPPEPVLGEDSESGELMVK